MSPRRLLAGLAATMLVLVLAEPGRASDPGGLRQAANRGNAEAQFRLGEAYANGDGVAQNVPEAAKWIRKAADQGLAKAQFALGVLCFAGEGVARDRVQGFMWILLAEERGSDGVPEIRDEFVKRMSAEEVARARKLAADKKRTAKWGADPEQSYRRAQADGPKATLQWYRDAAERGDPNAQFYLAAAYLGGNGVNVPRDEVEGLMWLKLAAASGGGYEQMYREAVASGAEPGKVAEAERRARAWRAKK